VLTNHITIKHSRQK